MGRTIKIYVGLLVLLLAAIAIVEARKPKPVDWTPTYSVNDKIPFGLYVFDRESTSMFDGDIKKIHQTPYEYLVPFYDYDSLVNTYTINGTFLDISEVDNLDSPSLTELFYFVGHGNTAFLSMTSYPAALLDSLDLEMQYDYEFTDTIHNWLANKKLGIQKYPMVQGVANAYFTKTDSTTTTTLGYQGTDSRTNFIKVAYRNGHFLLHTQPAAFTNLYLLKNNNASYAAGLLSYVPQGDDIFWYVRDSGVGSLSQSSMRYILNQPALASAWFLFLIGMMIFMLFNAKRKQRIVPIITPLTNTTVEFTKTIGNLYYQEGDFDTVIDKKIIYLLERLRHEYLLDTSVLDENFARKLAQKSGKDQVLINTAINRINAHRKSRHTSIESDLIEINNAIENIL